MATEVETGLGSTFKLADSGGTLTLIGEPTSIPIPTGSTDLIDASHYASVDYKDFISSPLKDGEEADIEMNWVPGSATDTLLRQSVGETRDFEIVVPAGQGTTSDGTYKFEGTVLVRQYQRENPFDDKRTGTLTVKWVGAVTETYTAPVDA
jgi:hypothetical protein